MALIILSLLWAERADAANLTDSLGDAIEICKATDAPADQRVNACGQILSEKDLPVKAAALAHYYRGLAKMRVKTAGSDTSANRESNAQAAMPDLDAAIALAPDFIAAYRLREHLHRYVHQFDESVFDIDKVISAYPKVAGLHVLRGTDLGDAGHFDAALSEFDTALALAGPDDNLPDIYWSRAVIHGAVQHWDQALADIDKAVPMATTRRRKFAVAEFRGRVEFLAGKYDAAVSDLTTAQKNSSEIDLYNLLWLYLAEARQGKDAAHNLWERLPFVDTTAWPGPILRLFAGAISLDQVTVPTDKSAYEQKGAQCELQFYLGELALLKGNRPEAAQHFRAAIDSHITEFVEYTSAQAELQRLTQ